PFCASLARPKPLLIDHTRSAMKRPALDRSQIAAQRHLSLSRRQFLRGVGACVALPVLGSALRGVSRAAAPVADGLATTASRAPLRMAFVYIPNGVHQEYWW